MLDISFQHPTESLQLYLTHFARSVTYVQLVYMEEAFPQDIILL